MTEVFDEDYFERGLETGKSCYQNYRWIPELTIPMAMTIIDYLRIEPHHTILDFGCAKGYLVKAMRWLNRKCFGLDISEYAIRNCDPEVREFCVCNGKPSKHTLEEPFDFCIAKDVFEHIPLDQLKLFFSVGIAKKYFVVVPLRRGIAFEAPANNMDCTHLNCMTESEWQGFFDKVGMIIETFTYKVEGIKDSYYKKYPTAHGFFILSHV